MERFGKPPATPHKDWDQTRVGEEFFRTLLNHPVFKRERNAINEAHSWLNEIAAAIHANNGRPATFGYKRIQDHFRKFTQSHVKFVHALGELGLITTTDEKAVKGQGRQFSLTFSGWRLLHDGNYRRLHLLITDPKTRRRNQVAIARRKLRRTVYTDPTMRAIDEFRYGVEFERAGLLKQLRVDSSHSDNAARNRRNFVVHPLLALVTRKFPELEMREGIIYHEWISIPWHYSRFATFRGKQYDRTMDCRGDLLRDHFPALFAYGEKLGLTLVYDYPRVSVFAHKNDPELAPALEKMEAFIRSGEITAQKTPA